MKRILVLGSLNADLVQRVPALPEKGETLKGQDLQVFAGGKGANQACAAARLGGQVTMAGVIGSDSFGQTLLDALRSCGVQTELIRSAEGPSGCAMILVLPSGENAIVISPGANAKFTPEYALAAVGALESGDVLLCQLEIPLESVATALRAARQRGVVTVLDPAPAYTLDSEVFTNTSIVTPNQTEAAFLVGSKQPIDSVDSAEAAARELLARGVQTVIIKLGNQGCLAVTKESRRAYPALPVKAVDTTAAGDAFNGALAVALARDASLPEAVKFANRAAALSVTRQGAISSLPDLREISEFGLVNNE